MKKNIWVVFMLVIYHTIISAAQPKFTVTPLSANEFSVPSNGAGAAAYRVTNNTKITRSLTMVPITGITQDTSAGNCSNPFVLANNQSCILQLQINGGLLTSNGVNIGPQICKAMAYGSPDPFLCSQPSFINRLNIVVDENSLQSYSLVVNASGNPLAFVSLCPLNTDGTFSASCEDSGVGGEVFDIPNDIALNNSGTFSYVTSGADDKVYKCPVNPNGTFNPCGETGSSFSDPNGIVLNRSENTAYITEPNINRVTKCSVNATNGEFASCSQLSENTNFNAPHFIALNEVNTFAYITNFGNGLVVKCPINPDGTFNTCIDAASGGFNFHGPEGIFIDNTRDIAYVVSINAKQVFTCQIDSTDGQLVSCGDSGAGVVFEEPVGITLNKSRSIAYIADHGNQKIFRCPINPIDGSLSACAKFGQGNFLNVSGILVTN